MTALSPRDPLAAEVLALLKAARLVRRDQTLEKAARHSMMSAPKHLQALTPRFEAYFAIATLARALTNRERRDSIDRRFALAVFLTETWLNTPVRQRSPVESSMSVGASNSSYCQPGTPRMSGR